MDVVNLLTPAAPAAQAKGKSAAGSAPAPGGFDDALVTARGAGDAPATTAAKAATQGPARATDGKVDPRTAPDQTDPHATLFEQLDAADLLATKGTRHAEANDAQDAHDKSDDSSARDANAGAAAAQLFPLLAAVTPTVTAPNPSPRDRPHTAPQAARTSVVRNALDSSPVATGKAATADANPDAPVARAQAQRQAAALRHASSPAPTAKAAAAAAIDPAATHGAVPANGNAFTTAALAAADTNRQANPVAHGDGTSSALNGLFGIGTLTQAGSASQPAPAAPAAPPVLQSSIGSNPWQQELGMQLVQLTQRGGQQVELHLNPKDLGPLQISLKLDHQNAQVQFFAAHALVRDAVQQAIPELRAALAGQGIALGEAMVGQQQQQSDAGGFTRSERGVHAIGRLRGGEGVQPAVAPRVPVHIAPGAGVDLYA